MPGWWELDYQLRTMSAKAIRGQARTVFNSEYARTWWTMAGPAYKDGATTKGEKEFVALLDGEFKAATSHAQGSNGGGTPR